MGAAFSQLVRMMSASYSDGVSSLAGADRPDARADSNAVNAQDDLVSNTNGASDYLW